MSDNIELYTRYTITLHDALIDNPDLLDGLVMSTADRTKKLKEMFINRWEIYEIGLETINLFKLCINNKFNTIVGFYEELLDAYETKINMLDGKKFSITTTRNKAINTNGNNENLNYDLPRTVQAESKPSSKSSSNSANNSNEDSTETITQTGNENVIELKKEYMKIIKNIYLDFAEDFKTCFLDLYY